MTRKALIVGAAAAVALCLAAPAPGQAQERLFMTSLSPAGSPNSMYFRAWAKRVNDASGGTLDVEVKDGIALAHFGNMYDRVVGNVVQIGWAIHQIFRGKFPRTEVGGLPFLSPSSEIGSMALWKLYAAGMFDDEYKEVVPLWLMAFPPSQIHYKKEPSTIENLNGLKIGAAGRMQSLLATSLGGTAISTLTQNMYEAQQRGTIDAHIISWAAFQPYKLYEVSSFHLEGPLGQNTNMFFMSRKRHDGLPEAARKAIDTNSGAAQVKDFGIYLDNQSAVERAPIIKSDKHKTVELTPAQTASWEKRFSPIIDEWAKGVPNGVAILAAYRKALAEVTPMASKH
jgi:TRAP-type transport system periplasmic protein